MTKYSTIIIVATNIFKQQAYFIKKNFNALIFTSWSKE